MKRFLLLLLAVSIIYAPPASVQNKSQGEINLRGVWMDNDKIVKITQSGAGVEAGYINPPMCDAGDGSAL